MILFYDEIKKKKKTYQDNIRGLRSLLKKEESELAKAFLLFLRKQKKTISLEKIKQALYLKRMDDEAVFEEWQKEYSEFIDSSQRPKWITAMLAGTVEIKQGQPRFSFDVKYDGVEAWLKTHAAELVKDITEAQRETLNMLIVRAAKTEIHPDSLARQIQSVIGLTRKDAIANQNYYLKRYESALKMNPKMAKAKAEQTAEKAAARYAEKQLIRRAETIARTELARGYHAGEYYGIKQAQRDGLMGRVKKQVSTAGDGGVCEDCKNIDGMEVDLDDTFPTNWGEILFPPWHPRCRCELLYIEVEKPVFMAA